jgi:hypothetical protein
MSEDECFFVEVLSLSLSLLSLVVYSSFRKGPSPICNQFYVIHSSKEL